MDKTKSFSLYVFHLRTSKSCSILISRVAYFVHTNLYLHLFQNFSITKFPRKHMIAIMKAAKDIISRDDPGLNKLLREKDIQIGFEGSFGSNSVSPRGLTSHLLNNLVKVEGIVTKCSSVRPKLVKSVHFSEKSSGYTNREYRDENSLDVGLTLDSRLILPQSAMPSKDADGNALDLEHGLSSYKDYQTVTLQEMPERARVGQLPRSVEIQLENDLVDRVKPGDRVQVVGIYRPQSSSSNGVVSAIFKSQLMCNNISIIGKEVGGIKLSASDIMECRKLSTHDDVLTVMSKSLCPSIFGHEFVKKALILQLLGGCERDLENGTHLRGDINVMMVGDPSTAKSQLLRSIMDIAPLAISTTGKGSSGVGLTAAVSMDPETNEKRLEAGAMVRVCVYVYECVCICCGVSMTSTTPPSSTHQLTHPPICIHIYTYIHTYTLTHRYRRIVTDLLRHVDDITGAGEYTICSVVSRSTLTASRSILNAHLGQS